MRTRNEILKEYKSESLKLLEVILDIRDLLIKQAKKPRKTKGG